MAKRAGLCLGVLKGGKGPSLPDIFTNWDNRRLQEVCSRLAHKHGQGSPRKHKVERRGHTLKTSIQGGQFRKGGGMRQT